MSSYFARLSDSPETCHRGKCQFCVRTTWLPPPLLMNFRYLRRGSSASDSANLADDWNHPGRSRLGVRAADPPPWGRRVGERGPARNPAPRVGLLL
jgi:hypothetical protein